MRRSQYRSADKSTKWFSGRRRIIAAVATLVAFGGIVTVTQVSNAATSSTKNQETARPEPNLDRRDDPAVAATRQRQPGQRPPQPVHLDDPLFTASYNAP